MRNKNNNKNLNTSSEKKFDYIIIGSGIISVLEAIYLSQSGKIVAMIDDADDIGGAWKCKNIFGYRNVENAVHYLLPNKVGIDFMINNLNWKVIKSMGKYKTFKIPIFGYINLPYDSSFSKYIAGVFINNSNILVETYKLIIGFFSISKNHSYYLENGSPEILHKTKQLLNESKVKTIFNTKITKIIINNNPNEVICITGEKRILTKKIIVTHGSLIDKIQSSEGEYKINKHIHPRPALHLLIKDPINNSLKQSIFMNDRQIKYIHDITEYSDDKNFLRESNKRIFVLALQHDIQNEKKLYKEIFMKMKKAKIISKKSELVDSYWSDIFLPTLYDEDLYNLKNKFRNHIEILRTENFSSAIGYYADRWKENITIKK